MKTFDFKSKSYVGLISDKAVIMVFIVVSVFSVGHQTMAQDEIKGGKGQHRDHFYEKGKSALDADRPQQAIKHLTKSLEYDPYYLDSYFLRALASQEVGDAAGALRDYSIVLHLEPTHSEGLFARGVLYYNTGKYEFAETDFLTLLKYPDTETNAIFFRVSNYESGASGVMTMEMKDAATHNYLGLARTKMKAYHKAITSFDRAIKLNGSDPDFYTNRALCREEMGQDELARSDYRRALAIDPENDLATYNLLRVSSSEESIDLYTDLINEDPHFAEPYAQRGLAKYNVGDYKGALADYNKAIELNNDNHELFLNRGLVLEQLLDHNGAISDYTTALVLEKDYAKAYFNRGNALSKKRQFQEAIEDYEVASSLGFGSASLYFNKGVALYYSAEYAAACENVTRALDMGMSSAQKAVDSMCSE